MNKNKYIGSLLHQPRFFWNKFLLKYIACVQKWVPRNILSIHTIYVTLISVEIYKAVYTWGMMGQVWEQFFSCYFLLAIFEALVIEKVKNKRQKGTQDVILERLLNSRLESQSWSFAITYTLLSSSATLLQCYLSPCFKGTKI